jgi:excisionase family DNA binding protein
MSDRPNLLDALRSELESIVRRELAAHRSEAADWYDQHTSPLGKSQHLRLVRAGKLPGFKVGKRVLVKRIDVDDYIARHPVARVVANVEQPSAPDNDIDEIDRLLARNGWVAASGNR